MDKPEKLDSLEKFLEYSQREGHFCKADLDWLREQTKTNPDDWWQRRENLRMRYGDRLQPQWTRRNEFRDFYIYIKRSEPMKIGYTPTPEYGAADRQIVTSIGKFMKKHFPRWNEGDVRALVDNHRAMYGSSEVSFAFDADDIEYVYENGPGSCMAGKEWQYENPVRVYDGPDTAVAFLQMPDKRITARTVCNIATKPMQYTRIYGDETVLRNRLEMLGFASGDLSGTRLRRQDVGDDVLVCPYIDNVSRAEDTGEFLKLGDGRLDCQTTAGYLGNDSYTCDHCENDCDELVGALSPGGDDYQICESCANDNYNQAIYNHHGDSTYVYDENVITIDDEYYLDDSDLLNELGFMYSEAEGEWGSGNRFVWVESDNDHRLIEDTCTPVHCDEVHLQKDCTQGENGDWILDDDAVETHDGRTYHEQDIIEVGGKIYHEDDEIPDADLTPADPAEFAARQGQLEVA